MSEELSQALIDIVTSRSAPDQETITRFLTRVDEGKLTRDENPHTHFCVYFAAYDPQAQEIFIGHHKKSGLWLFNGGHIDQGETPQAALAREMIEEWGVSVVIPPGQPAFFTLTRILDPTLVCKYHYDLWHLLPVNKELFAPDAVALGQEFYQIGWKTFAEARKLVTDPNTLFAIHQIEALIQVV